MSTKVGFHDNNAAFMRSGDLSTRSRNQSDILQNSTMHPNTGFNKSGLKIEGSPMGIKTGQKMPENNTPLLPPMPPPPLTQAKAPSRTYAYQVSQLSVNDKQESSARNVDLKNVTGASKRANPKVVVSNTTKGAIHHSTSKDILNDDMREVFSAGSKLA